uniref:MSP domain-containing protein n=1 Tax=Ditylenchus dipsaci TaxID=166011 RepID=A0A915EP56_9BILA
MKDTELHFLPVRGRTDIARVQLLLSNISDRSLHYKLKCSSHGNISALPSSSGQIQAKSTSRITLTLHRPENCPGWAMVKKPKMLLVTTFNDADQKQSKADVTSTRLVAVVLSEKIERTESPIEQLLLDAVSKTSIGSQENVDVRKASEVEKPVYQIISTTS